LKDYLEPQLGEIPYFRALLRAVEARFYQEIELPRPVLDLGCGDGHFASQAFDNRLDVGLDPWWGPIKEASGRDVYRQLVCANGGGMPFPVAYFSSAVSNSVLEHIPELDPVLQETARVLKPSAPFVFCVHNHRFLDTLSIASWLKAIKLPGLAKAYQRFFNRISRHYHCDSTQLWEDRLARHGFELIDCWDYFPPAALHVLEWGHLFGIPSWVSKMLFKHWILAPWKWNLYFTDLLVRPHYQRDPRCQNGVYSFYITRRAG
jgi:SAM-dependent methyltransferase